MHPSVPHTRWNIFFRKNAWAPDVSYNYYYLMYSLMSYFSVAHYLLSYLEKFKLNVSYNYYYFFFFSVGNPAKWLGPWDSWHNSHMWGDGNSHMRGETDTSRTTHTCEVIETRTCDETLGGLGFEPCLLPLCICELLPHMCELYLFSSHVWVSITLHVWVVFMPPHMCEFPSPHMCELCA